MSEFFFCVHQGPLTHNEQLQRERVAAKHGATHVYATIPGTGLVSWFAARNWGDVRNNALERAVRLDLEPLGEVKS